MHGHHGDAAAGEHDLVDLGEVGARRLHAGAEGPQHPGGLLDGPHVVGVHGEEAAKVGRPRHAPALDRRRAHRPRELARVDAVGDRRAVVGAGHDGEHEGHVRHRTRHRPGDGQRVPAELHRVLRHEPRRGAEADDAAERRGHPERAAEVRALRDRAHAGGERHRGAAARPPARERGVPGIARRSEHRVEGVAARAELGRVGLAHDDGARRLEALDDERVLFRHVVLVDLRTPRRADALGRGEVLDRHRHAVERRERGAAPERGGGPARSGQRRVAREGARRRSARD